MNEMSSETTMPRSVALLIETGGAYPRSLLDGVAKYQRQNPHWKIAFVKRGPRERPPDWLSTWKGDGIIARVDTYEMAEALRRTGLPVVNTSAQYEVPEFPVIKWDGDTAAELVIDHFRQQGFKQFAFCGGSTRKWSEDRKAAFLGRLAKLNIASHHETVYELHTPIDGCPHDQTKRIMEWLKKLPKPIAIWASLDSLGIVVVEAAIRAGLRVPDDVAVMGIDNDEMFCRISRVPLSSVSLDGERVGYEAAQWLEAIMAGAHVPADTIRTVPPSGLIARDSTDMRIGKAGLGIQPNRRRPEPVGPVTRVNRNHSDSFSSL
jgi:LacI family transcriptional regulator